MRDILLIIDMQNDFITGALGTPEAEAIVDAVAEEAGKYPAKDIIATRDTHGPDYLQTQEGQKLPVPHCILDTEGWQISDKLQVLADDLIIDKPTFGSTQLAHHMAGLDDVESIELVGLCTDICVISNAMLLKAALPEVPVAVDAKGCAGVTSESHKNALQAMTMCQIDIVNG